MPGHAMDDTIEGKRTGSKAKTVYTRKNRMLRFCFIGLTLAAPPSLKLGAAEPVLSSPKPITTVRADRSSGRLVRTEVITPKVIAAKVISPGLTPEPEPETPKLGPDASIGEIVADAARRHEVDPLLVHSVIKVESAYNKYAVSKAGAQGLMQLIPSTAQRLGVKNVFDPRENIEAGVRYLKQLQLQFKDDRLALAAYNAGEGAVARYGNIPPYSETQNYVYQVGKNWGAAKRAVQATPAQPVSQKPDVKKIVTFVDAEGRVHYEMRD